MVLQTNAELKVPITFQFFAGPTSIKINFSSFIISRQMAIRRLRFSIEHDSWWLLDVWPVSELTVVWHFHIDKRSR